ncbi:calponin domain-containing protein [Acrasis kona]|uniref:Calponin domain-containing protein n=1 Tax=Acrasis kona TaxID=1008807 RepID=A0AAW2YM19_9EUKA
MSSYVQYDPSQVATNKDGIPIYGMDLELEAKKMAKYDKEKEGNVRYWIEAVTGESFKNDDFQDSLKDGLLLCKLANAIKPGSVPKVNNSKLNFMQMENVGYFLKAAANMGLKPHDSFQTVDLFEGKNIPQVIQALFNFGGVVQKQPGYTGPCLGVKMAEKQNIQFTEDQLRRSSNTVGLQYEGSFKHATGLNASREVVKTKDTGVRGATTQQMSGSIAYDQGKSIHNNIVKVVQQPTSPGPTTQNITFTSTATVDENSFDDLEKLAELRDAGILTFEEFETKKNQILGL